MPTFEIDDQFAFHQKTVMAGNEAIGVWARAGSWCAGYLTDGSVPRDIAGTLGGQSLWTKLISVGLVEETVDGYQLHDYLHWNRPASAILDDRRRAAEKKRDQRAKLRADSKCPPGTSKGTPPGRPHACPPPVPPSPAPSPAPSQSEEILRAPLELAEVPAKEKTPAQLVTDCYFAEYKRVRGKAPPFGARDGRAVKELLASMAGDPVRVCAAIRKAFLDPFWADKATICAINADPGRFDGGLFGTLPAQARPKNAYPVQGGNGGVAYLDKLRAQREAAKDQPFEMIECIDEI